MGPAQSYFQPESNEAPFTNFRISAIQIGCSGFIVSETVPFRTWVLGYVRKQGIAAFGHRL
ncbi:hypothetical protein Y027_4697 [Burkholderia pseudomallei TSV5]|nr:hypothetical protein Y027_4697 [Burkholderia pseudomallei TSV5]